MIKLEWFKWFGMAYCEKICEFSGDFVGYEMVKISRKHLQILPQYRRRFKGRNATLTLVRKEKCTVMRGRGLHDITGCYYDHEGDEQLLPNEYVSHQWFFIFKPEGEDLKGVVNGEYLIITRYPTTLKRRLKRMLGKRGKLTIVKNLKYYDD